MSDTSEFVRRPELGMLLSMVEPGAHRGVLLVGTAGAGKTALLRMAEAELDRRGRPVFWVSCKEVRSVEDLGEQIIVAVRSSRFAGGLIDGDVLRRTSSLPFFQTVALLDQSVRAAPVLMLDGLDEAPRRGRLVSGIQQLILALRGWSIVISSRDFDGLEFRHSRELARLSLTALSLADADALVRLHAPSASDDEVALITQMSGGLPLAAALLARTVGAGHEVDPDMLTTFVAQSVDDAITASADPVSLARVVDELALFGGSCAIEVLAARLDIPVPTLRVLLDSSHLFVGADAEWTTVSFFHDMIQDFVLAERVRFQPIRLADLDFGAEEAEKDRLLEPTFVESRSVLTILDQRQTVIVGDRGSGKSALFRKLSAGGEEVVRVCPVTDAGDMLHRVVAADAWQDAQALRAAWLVVLAAVVAGEIPDTAPQSLRRTARDLCMALGRPVVKPGRLRRFGRALVRPFLGTKLSFAVGPVTLQAELPAGSSGRHGKALLDVASFLRDADAQLKADGRRVVVMLDRIDETFKYDREKQEPIVQALLQAEGQINLLHNTDMIIFIRTDLFELYDIQEKNKLVSRTLTLDWDEEEWLQVLVGRVLANKGLQVLADRTPIARDRVRSALPLMFPAEIEGQPVDRWLLDGLRNGNGDISPRLAVLLLHLARKRADEAESTVARFPLFSAATLGVAMTQLSELSFTEVVTDFKVAPSFVANCRAGRLETFRLDEVKGLFDLTEGSISEQIRLLERLGFLERVVRATDTDAVSMFHVPRLYTRCWDYA